MEYLVPIVCSLLSLLVCAGFGFLLFVVVVGFVILRRRGKEEVSAKEALDAGVESVSQVFIRGQGGLEPADDDDDDE